MLNNPTPIIYQRINSEINTMADKKPIQEKGGLLGPKKQVYNSQDADIYSPAKRVIGYVQEIRKKREELKNG